MVELAADGDDTSIVFELSRDLRDAGSAVSVIMGSRTKVPGWGQIHDPRPDHSRHEIQTVHPWCGQCTERTRLTNYYNPQTGESRPGRCRTPVVDHTGQTVACHPYATPRHEVEEASDAPEPEEMSTEEFQAAMEDSFKKAAATARSGADRARKELAREREQAAQN